MMFMMPIPPTSSEMPAMAPMTMLKMRWVFCRCFSRASGMVMLKSLTMLWRRCMDLLTMLAAS